MRNAGLVEAQAEIKIAGRNINNLRFTDDTTFIAERKEELNRLLMKVKEEIEKASLKLNFQKTKIVASRPTFLLITTASIPELTWRNTVLFFFFNFLSKKK